MSIKIFRYTFLFVLLVSTFTSCDIFDDVEVPETDTYLVSHDQYKSYLPAFIESAFDMFIPDYPELAAIKDKVDYGIIIYKITYNTTFNGEPKLASGLVCVPMGTETFPVLSYQNGTNTLHNHAPSVDPDDELYLLLEFMASTGFIVAIPDYLGFGVADDMFHPYLHGESTVQTVTDMLRAVDELVNHHLDINMSNDLYISGYSQGGWATMKVQKAIDTQFPGEFNLKASACGAGPYNLNTINEYVIAQQEYPMPYFVGYIFNSYMNLELTTPITDIFQEPYAGSIPNLYDGSKSGDEINEQLTTTVAELFTEDYIANQATDNKYEPVHEMLNDNSVNAYSTTTPTLIIHGTDDTFVPYIVSDDIYNEFMAAGVSGGVVKLVPLQGHNHTSGILPSGLISITWFLDIRDGTNISELL
ncbi:MAG: prolyl oligopeptidase family serine peptidase [Bacteroidota bacterium]